MPASGLSAKQLAGLYLGDRYSLGYYHAQLVFEICKREQPVTFERLRSWMFGASTSVDKIDEDAYEVLREDYEYWEQLKRPRCK